MSTVQPNQKQAARPTTEGLGQVDIAAMPPISSAPRRQATRDEADTDRSIREDVARAPQDLVRQRVGIVDQFHLPQAIKDRYAEAGWSLEWKRHSCFGQEDWSYENAMAENHWQPVGADELPGFMPPGYAGAVIRDGLVLMKRPAYLTEQARHEDSRLARDQIASKEAQLGDAPPGTLTRDHAEVRPKVAKSFAPIDVPADE